jgi:hypothetical protein
MNFRDIARLISPLVRSRSTTDVTSGRRIFGVAASVTYTAHLQRNCRRADDEGMDKDKTTVDLRIGGDHFHVERDSITGEMLYFLNDLAVTVTAYLAQMQHYREMDLQRLYGRRH